MQPEIVWRATISYGNEVLVGSSEVRSRTDKQLLLSSRLEAFSYKLKVDPSWVFQTRRLALEDLEKRLNDQMESLKQKLAETGELFDGVRAMLEDEE